MWRPSNLPDHLPPNPSTLFAAQAWHELLSPQSPDTFQARALDLPTLLEEVAEVANLSSEDERWRAHLPMVADELHECCQADYLSTDLRLRTSIDDVVKTIHSSQEPLRVTYERAQIALGLFGSAQRRWRNDAIRMAVNNLYRLYRAWRELHDSNNLARSMAGSRHRIEWQIARIYRARNLLVHRGEESRYLWRLLRNAQYYVSSAISRVLHDLRDQSRWTVDTSLEHQLQRYNYLYERLSNHAGAGVKYSDLLVRNTRRSDTPVWP